MYNPLTQNIQVGCLVQYFDPSIISGTSHKLRLFWAGPYQVMKLIAPALAMLQVPPAWNEVPDLMMEDEDGMMIKEADTKRKRDEVAWR